MTDTTTAAPAADAGDDAAQQMLANAVQSGQQADPAQQQQQPPVDAQPDLKADVDKWKSLARKHETTAKANAAAAAELAQLKDAQKTSEQRLSDQLTAAQVQLAEYQTRETRVNAAVQVGLTPDMAEFLTETDPAAVLEQAKRLAERLKPAEPSAPPAAPNLRQGAVGGAANPPQDPNLWLRRMAGRA